jgi:hypothetical protein
MFAFLIVSQSHKIIPNSVTSQSNTSQINNSLIISMLCHKEKSLLNFQSNNSQIKILLIINALKWKN